MHRPLIPHLLFLLAWAGARSAAADSILITEVVTDPQADHSENTGGNGTPYDLLPGTGTVSTVDEFIELYNASSRIVDLRGYVLDFDDSTPSSYTFGSTGGGVLRFSAGSGLEAVRPGGFVLLGNPPGALNNAIDLVLRDAAGSVADRLEIADGNATSALDETIERVWNGSGFLTRFRHAPISPLAPGAPTPEPGTLLLVGLSALVAGRATARRARLGPRRRRPGPPALPYCPRRGISGGR